MANIEKAMRESREIIESTAAEVYGYGHTYDAIMIAINGYEKVLNALRAQKGEQHGD